MLCQLGGVAKTASNVPSLDWWRGGCSGGLSGRSGGLLRGSCRSGASSEVVVVVETASCEVVVVVEAGGSGSSVQNLVEAGLRHSTASMAAFLSINTPLLGSERLDWGKTSR